MDLAIDHISFAWHDLDDGPHSVRAARPGHRLWETRDHGHTHMALFGCDDLTSVEFLAMWRRGDQDF